MGSCLGRVLQILSRVCLWGWGSESLNNIDINNYYCTSSFRSSHIYHFDYFATVYTVFVCFHNMAFSAFLTRNGHGIFNVRNGLSVCCASEGVRSTEESAHVLTRKGQRDPSPFLDLEWNPGLGGVTLIILQTIPPTRCHLG